jgi:riboflavin biosynthesis pyrimidine reductase
VTPLSPLETLWEKGQGMDLPLPHELNALYGPLRFSLPAERPYVLGNFVSTLDGVVALNAPGQKAGGPISGFNLHDRMVMGLLRAVSDAVIVGAGTLRSVPDHLWTPDYIYPQLKRPFQELRASLGKPEHPLNVVVTASGNLDLALPVFQSHHVQTLILTTEEGGRRFQGRALPPSVEVVAVKAAGRICAREIIHSVSLSRPSEIILVEGGPHLLGDFLEEGRLDELFLTLAPQVAGRDGPGERPGLVAGRTFSPEHPLWGTLAGVKRAGNHLFLRYGFEGSARP